MQRLSPFCFICLASLFLAQACHIPQSAENWYQFVPASSPVMESGPADTSSSAFTALAGLTAHHIPAAIQGLNGHPRLAGRALVPVNMDRLEHLWIFHDADDLVPQAERAGWIRGSGYDTGHGHIQRYEKGDIFFYAASKSVWTLISTHSLPVEQALREAATANKPIIPNQKLLINAGSIALLGTPFVQPGIQASLDRVLNGFTTGPIQAVPTADFDILLDGIFPETENYSVLSSYLRMRGYENELSRDIPADVALAFFFSDDMHAQELKEVRYRGIADTEVSRLSQHAQAIESALLPDMAFVLLPGQAGDVAFVRAIHREKAVDALAGLFGSGHIDGSNDLFQVRSRYLGRFFGSGLCTFENFYIALGNNRIAISPKAAVARRLAEAPYEPLEEHPDFNRFREQTGKTGSFLWVDIPAFLPAARQSQWLATRPMPGALLAYQWLAVHTVYAESALKARFASGKNQQRNPSNMALLWQLPLRNGSLVAPPLFTQLNNHPMVITTSEDGTVTAVRPDGTIAFEVTTGLQRPVGGPIVADWYGSRSPVLLQAAGNMVYAWSPGGSLLPGFPFVLDAEIAVPPIITDANADDEMDMVVATRDGRVHLINRDGRGVAGWPVYARGSVSGITAPVRDRTAPWHVLTRSEYGWQAFDRTGLPMEMPVSTVVADSLIAVAHAPLNIWDVNGDEVPDIMQISDAGNVEVRDGKTDRIMDQYRRLSGFTQVMIADIDADGLPELIGQIDGQLRCVRLGTNRSRPAN